MRLPQHEEGDKEVVRVPETFVAGIRATHFFLTRKVHHCGKTCRHDPPRRSRPRGEVGEKEALESRAVVLR